MSNVICKSRMWHTSVPTLSWNDCLFPERVGKAANEPECRGSRRHRGTRRRELRCCPDWASNDGRRWQLRPSEARGSMKQEKRWQLRKGGGRGCRRMRSEGEESIWSLEHYLPLALQWKALESPLTKRQRWLGTGSEPCLTGPRWSCPFYFPWILSLPEVVFVDTWFIDNWLV